MSVEEAKKLLVKKEINTKIAEILERHLWSTDVRPALVDPSRNFF